MAKKSDSFYFGNFYACADCAYQAAHLLERVMRDFDPLLIREKLDDMHKVETPLTRKSTRCWTLWSRRSSPPSSGRTSSCSAEHR